MERGFTLTASAVHSLTLAQRQRLDLFATGINTPVVIGWDDTLNGPILRLVTGNLLTITRDGGFEFHVYHSE